jgi:pyrimidine-nucleoside phosphorylase
MRNPHARSGFREDIGRDIDCSKTVRREVQEHCCEVRDGAEAVNQEIACEVQAADQTAAETIIALNQLFDFIDSVRSRSPSIDELTEYARMLAHSGQVFRPDALQTADVSSTGGPTSLSTLLCPLHLVALGWQVPKLGVVGRPAGGLDVMAQIPGYRTDGDEAEIRAILRKCGYVNCEAGDRFAPADAETFRYRKRVGLQANGALAAASLIAKKVTMGVKRAGLDVRVAPHGNFGADFASASLNSRLFVALAREFGIEAVCYLTDASVPFQPYLGRTEALVALSDIFEDNANGWLRRHAELCLAMSLDLAKCSPTAAPAHDALRDVFRRHVVAHGGQVDGFDDIVDRTRSAHNFKVCAETDGYVSYNIAAFREVLVTAQAQRPGEFADPVGVILSAEPNAFVRKGSVLLTARIDEGLVEEVYPSLAGCVNLTQISTGIAEVVRG